MIEPDHAHYYRHRAVVARVMAARATDPRIARLHLDFAEGYRRRAESAPLPLPQDV